MSGRRVGGRVANAQAGWHEVGGRRVYFRSQLELRHAQLLEMQARAGLLTWEHEPKRFDFPCRGPGYLPDFRVTYPDRVVWHETKGYLDPASITKLVRMARYYPEETVVLVGARLGEKDAARVERAREMGRREVEKAKRREAKRRAA